MRLAALSVDLDEIPCYTAIHGIEPADPAASHAIYERAVPRFEELFADEGVPATFFVIGRDLESPENVARVKKLHASGHEIANHSYSHLYDLTRQPLEVIHDEIDRGASAIEAAVGVRPRGFRAPGYTITDTVFEVLGDLGVSYDSSVFPCAAYYAAKTAAIAGIALRRRKSHSIVDDPRVLTAPADPYRVGKPYWRSGRGILELPIGVTRDITGRLPYIGTSLVLGGEKVATLLTSAIVGRPFVNLELHGIDLADASEDGLDFLKPHQPDLRKNVVEKRAALRAAIRGLRNAGYTFVTCEGTIIKNM